MSDRVFSRARTANALTRMLCGRRKALSLLAALLLFCCTAGAGVFGAYKFAAIRAQLAGSAILQSLLKSGETNALEAAPRDILLLTGFLQEMAPSAQRLDIPPHRQISIFLALRSAAYAHGVKLSAFRYSAFTHELEAVCAGQDGEAFARALKDSGQFDSVVCIYDTNGKQFTIRCAIPAEEM